MFAYCYNSPVCLADYTGEDAIYVAVTDLNGLPVVGHAVLFIQDANGKWYWHSSTAAPIMAGTIFCSITVSIMLRNCCKQGIPKGKITMILEVLSAISEKASKYISIGVATATASMKGE